MASPLPLSFSSENKYYPNETLLFISRQEMTQQNDIQHMFYNNPLMWHGQEECFLPFSNNVGCFDNLFPSECSNNNSIDCSSTSNSLVDVPSLGASGFCEGTVSSTLRNYVTCTNYFNATLPHSWGFEGHTPPLSILENNCSSINKAGRYSKEEKKDRILRYLKKRNQRNFRKTIKYACRKTLADRRVRIRGRFAKNQEEDQSPLSNYKRLDTHQPPSQALPYHNVDNKSEEYGDINEQWLQEALSSLLYMPCNSNWHPELHDF